MTREETQKLLLAINSLYPNFKPEDPTLAVDTWFWALKDYPASSIMNALHNFVKNGNSGFAPSASQLIGNMGFMDKVRPETRAFIQELDGGAERYLTDKGALIE